MDCDGYPRIPMPLMCTAFVPGQIDAAVAGISDPDSRTIATAEALYFRGQATLAAETARPYLDATDPALRYSACFICGYASLSLNRIADARRCLAGILDTPTDEESPAVHATHILFASAASVLLHLPSPYSAEEFYPLAAHLPEGLRLFASYVMAHALYLRGEYGRSLGMAENALIMKQGSYPISELFLHLSASMACMSLKDIDAAKAHFGAAWDIARPDGLIELIGEHHGQSERAQKLGLKIIGHMRERCDARSAEKKLNYTLLATPAEGLSGRFVKLDQKRYGKIAGVTDREYYTNSFHIPVYCPISAFDKIRLEAPYHALTNAGHISYIEMDGDPTKNLDAFEAVVRAMHDAGIGYGSINHPVDRDPVCGYNGIIGDSCPKCGRQEEEVHFERIRRITGYLVGTLDRFNNGKRAEEHDRVKHGM